MRRISSITILVILIVGAMAQLKAAEKIFFEPYEAIAIDSGVIRGVKVEESGKIWLLLNPEHRGRKLTLRISEEEGAGYRKWHSGEYDLISPAGQDKKANDWTDWIETQATYIEYWMDGKKILHLKKVK